ncbi:nicotinate-nucleotide--dimethylbenzimidazole phosphoribosyltransferase [Alicyclobacillus sp. TC]|uniref:Nicotinate-nucleotide--dimethylbenzimidazole phosphoribosyltransferase n=1 Tax=Alicyclobacillus tolerans TaxID=90970 RepID=A0A1M6V050_9BACL|nr:MULTISPECIES: nicotinate-nucleotide--dimethylbenzimidazole phosphoribosyltransferase [Alicyclobacillus]QRF22876.1 nicotinate-nucleotide--dimethylbenzimidazole phosphoribosyltransferase [Alicyclobacillus sp. TC]SHK74833.1 nicotinate-nucleotide-dimethylbenzimidazole phosphoribosyltransferase /cob(II)yrinic acid a,c-diamide reductase [Alicyclobacillus montanus]
MSHSFLNKAQLGEWAERRAHARLRDLTKPLGSLGELEHLIARLARITGRVIPKLERPALLMFAADHGVTREGVSAYGDEVTEEMVVNICMGGAVSSVLARQQEIPITVVDVGVRSRVRHPAAHVCKVDLGTKNLAIEPAMTRQQAEQAVETGKQFANQLIHAGHDVILVGEMGIGNTTASSAMAAQLLQCSISEVLGRGTGLNDDALAKKSEVLSKAVTLHSPFIQNDWDILVRLGGFEIAAIAGVIWAASERNVPVVLDGFITCTAALWAVQVEPRSSEYLLASHVSAEPGHRLVLQKLGLRPLLDIGMRLGEGSGALLSFPMIRLACHIMAETATFTDARVSHPHRIQQETSEMAANVEHEAGKIGFTPIQLDFNKEEQAAVYKAILARRDIRVFLPDPIPDSVLQRILLAAHHGPSVGYMQPWNFIVIRDKRILQELQKVVERERVRAAENYLDLEQAHYLRLKVEGLLQAPLTICVTNDPNKSDKPVLGRNTIPETDLMSTACAIENMWLAARAEGVAIGWVSMYQKADVREILEIPDTVDPVALLTMGYTPHFPEIPVLERVGWGNRLPLEDIVFENVWGKSQR